jgi:hypothetical protein
MNGGDNMNVFIVTEGKYSDYEIVAVFSTREKAEEFLSANKYGQIEVFDIDPEFWAPPDGMELWSLVMEKDGRVEYIQTRFNSPFNNSYATKYKLVDAGRRSHKPGSGRVYSLKWEGWAKSEEHAIKAANEVRAQLIANNEWE